MSDFEKLPILKPDEVKPLEYRIMVMVERAEEVSKGGIILAATTREKQEFGEIIATFIKGGELAFSSDIDGQKIPDAPTSGQKIVISKYSGLPFRDEAGNMYRFANDKDVVAVYGG